MQVTPTDKKIEIRNSETQKTNKKFKNSPNRVPERQQWGLGRGCVCRDNARTFSGMEGRPKCYDSEISSNPTQEK